MKLKIVISLISLIVVVAVIVIVVVVVKNNKTSGNQVNKNSTNEVNPNKASLYSKAAVASDAKVCSKVGKDILLKNGSAVDATVATLICIGLVNMHSCGLGGGGFMNVYERKTKKSFIYDFRETAPAAANETMFINASSTEGALAAGVPGNVKGLYYVHTKHGKLPWRELVQPTIDLARKGFELTNATYLSTVSLKSKIEERPNLRKLFIKPDGTWMKAGENFTNPILANTLETIRDNPEDFYNGGLAEQFVKDIQNEGGIITLDDMKNYTVVERQPLITEINGLKYYLMPPPGSATVVAMTLNILKGFNLTAKDYDTEEKKIKVMHKFIEALKFSYARRPLLGDPGFINTTEVTDAMLNQTFAEILRKRIKENETYFNESFYGGYYAQNQMPYGTSHVSVLAENGDAVAATDTINAIFGGLVRSNKTGIIYNNEMDDFSSPSLMNKWGYYPSKANYIKPGKRPLSSMSPIIVVDSLGDVIMVVGGSGGSRIISGTTFTLFRKLFLDMELGEAIVEERVHTHLSPNEVYITEKYPISQAMQDGLKKLGHKLTTSTLWVAVQAVYRKAAGEQISAKSDPRKGGFPDGY
ncbi:glutathione hydrolase 1 proenzyme [Hydra vulgaris]|uniref:Glutathione hydrolase 1 proenzyme n=1 Tax=Hydra vulgaris TaxID=6087 RepID=A0ABM4CMN8_HYDVU